MMKDAKVPLDKTSLEIIYKSENKSNTMSFNQFLNAIVKISSELTANISTKVDQKKIIFNFINMLNNTVPTIIPAKINKINLYLLINNDAFTTWPFLFYLLHCMFRFIYICHNCSNSF